MKKLIVYLNENFQATDEQMNALQESIADPNKPVVVVNGDVIKRIEEVEVPNTIEYKLGGGLLHEESTSEGRLGKRLIIRS